MQLLAREWRRSCAKARWYGEMYGHVRWDHGADHRLHAKQRPPERLTQTFSISRHDISRTIPMLANTVKIAFAAAALMLLTPSADAQQIHPRCAKFNFRDK